MDVVAVIFFDAHRAMVIFKHDVIDAALTQNVRNDAADFRKPNHNYVLRNITNFSFNLIVLQHFFGVEVSFDFSSGSSK